MNGVLLNRHTGLPEGTADGWHIPDRDPDPTPGSWVPVGTYINPAILETAPAHVLENLRMAALDPHNSPRMSGSTWQETVSSLPQDATQVLNSTAETIMVPNFVWPNSGPQALYVGKRVRWTMWARVSTVVTTPGTIIFRLRWGGVAGTLLVTSKTQRPKVTVSTNMSAYVQMEMTCRSTGATGSVFAMGLCDLGNTIGDAQSLE
jgi:hypothetical protein